ncbi:MAG TPA: hypothetical protein VE244_01025 [Nitrososphaeraceae archaeon]|nr:hypothetical protein [Nitrososphaeraceae archaeon]
MIAISHNNNNKSLEEHMKTTTITENTKDRLRSTIKAETTGSGKNIAPNHSSNIDSNSSSINQAKAEKKESFYY